MDIIIKFKWVTWTNASLDVALKLANDDDDDEVEAIKEVRVARKTREKEERAEEPSL